MEDKNPLCSVWLNYNPKAQSYNVTRDGKLMKVFTSKERAVKWLGAEHWIYFDNCKDEAIAKQKEAP